MLQLCLGSLPVMDRVSPRGERMGRHEPSFVGSLHPLLPSLGQSLAVTTVTGETNSWFGKSWIFKPPLWLTVELDAAGLAVS